jgi:hypothetical protein
LTLRADALFELTDAMLCADGPVRSLVELTLVAALDESRVPHFHRNNERPEAR